MNLDLSPTDGIAHRIWIRGQLDQDSVGRLEDVLLGLTLTLPIVIDASGIEFVDRSTLRLLLSCAVRWRGDPLIVLRNPSASVRRLFDVALPAGFPGLLIEVDGAGPGAAHRLTALVHSTRELLAAVQRNHERASRNVLHARRLRAEIDSLRASRKAA